MLIKGPTFTGRWLTVFGVCLSLLAPGCAPGPVGVMPGPLDGTWTSPHLAYDMELHGPFGVATRVRVAQVRDGDPVFRIISAEGTRFTARQWLPDGTWHTVIGELKDGKLHCRDGGTTWVMERRK